MHSVFLDLTIVICLAAFLSVVFRFLKQPVILAYILTGVIIGPLGFFSVQSAQILQSLAEIGITLLLFMLGLELRLSELRSVGKVAIITGIAQIVITSIIGYGISLLLGFSSLVSLYLALALTLSSTIIVVKLLSDKKDLNSLYGKITLGFLLVQDFVAMSALILLSGLTQSANHAITLAAIGMLIFKAGILFGWIIVLSKTILPKLVDRIARSSETLFLFSIAWAFGVAALTSSSFIGFSVEIGGFLAGLSLANSAETFQISAKVKSLRDFFITLFFVTLGMHMVFTNIFHLLIPAIILSIFVLIGNPLIVMGILGLQGYRKRTGFLSGLTVAQISEFSLIIIFMGSRIGHLSDEIVSLVTLIGAITFVFSTYMILHGNTLYKYFAPYLDIFERGEPTEKKIDIGEMKGHVVLIGARRMGRSILEALIKTHEQVVVVDFDPDVVSQLSKEGITSFFGDIADPEIQVVAGLDSAKLVISTAADVEDNLLLIKGLNKTNRLAKVVCIALEVDEAKALYKAGADYVVLPHLAGGRHLAKILVDKNHMELIEEYKAKDLSYLSL